MLDFAAFLAGAKAPHESLVVEDVVAALAAFGLPITPANILAVGWPLARGEFDDLLVVQH